MDTQKSPASRIRQILAAMERSIDVARSRRVNVNTHDSVGQSATSGAPSPSLGESTALLGRTEAPMPAASRINQVIGAPATPSAVGNPVPSPNAPQTPPRLKARPKRFDGSFPAPFTQSAYRSQTG